MKKLLMLASILVLAACQQPMTKKQPPPSAPADIGPTMAGIRTVIGQPVASDISACRLIAVGEKACGGPERYLVYSTETVSSEEQLLQLVRQYNQLSQERSKGRFSTCEFIPRPRVTVKSGQCEMVNIGGR